MATRYWRNTGSGDFFDPASWTPEGAPQRGDTLVASGTITLDHVALDGYRLVIGGRLPPMFLNVESVALGRGMTVEVTDDRPLMLRGAHAIMTASGWNLSLGAIKVTAAYATTHLALNIADGTTSWGAGLPGVFVNAGVMSATANATLAVSAKSAQARLINLGTVELAGKGYFDTDVTGIGSFRLQGPQFVNGAWQGGGELTVTRDVGAGQTVSFEGGQLDIGDLDGFHALLRGFGDDPAERIDLLGLDVAGLSYAGGARGGVLSLQDAGGAVLGTLRFAGHYTAGSFALVQEEGGTAILSTRA